MKGKRVDKHKKSREKHFAKEFEKKYEMQVRRSFFKNDGKQKITRVKVEIVSIKFPQDGFGVIFAFNDFDENGLPLVMRMYAVGVHHSRPESFGEVSEILYIESDKGGGDIKINVFHEDPTPSKRIIRIPVKINVRGKGFRAFGFPDEIVVPRKILDC